MTNQADLGEGMFRELKWVHDMLRRDLATVRRLADDIGQGASPGDVRSTVEHLQTRGPLWQLRVNCLQYCSIVHSHHGLESAMLFPAIRESDPERLGAVVDRLESDHVRISGLLDEVEEATQEMSTEDAAARNRLRTALNDLSEHLLEHLAYEEESIGPVLSTWSFWP